MTREEAISYIRDILAENNSIKPSMVVFELEKEALYLAIKALEQQPCEDAISRADVKKYLSAPDAKGDRVIYESDLDLLPPGTPKAEQKAILDKIIAEIWEEAEWAYSDFDDYKEAVLGAEPDELPDDEFRFGLHRAVEIINKYKTESEE